MNTSDYIIRKATLDDRAAMTDLIAASARHLSKDEYSELQIETAIKTVFGIDTDLINDETYFVAQSGSTLVGCGGWSRRKTLFGGDQFSQRDANYLDPTREPAKIRAFFVHPEHARKGIGKAILDTCENEARLFGFTSIELMSTLPGIKLYQACGYIPREPFDLELGDGIKLELLAMQKDF